MERYIPDIYEKSIYAIDYAKLKMRGIKCILMDLDNTLVAPSIKKPSKKNKELFSSLKEMGFRVILFSNSIARRVKPFKEVLGVDFVSFACKPSSRKFLWILENYHYNESEVAIIGDQLMTDVLGGNKVGITTILVNPVSPKEPFVTRFNRYRERRILKKLRNRDLFMKGKYYE